MSVNKELATLNALGNGALGGSMGNAGQTTGQLANPMADIGMDATNSMGRMSAEDSGSSPYAECYEESHDFTATASKTGSAGAMGSARLVD